MSESRQPIGLPDQWDNGTAYEQYVGRWSRLVAREFLRWLNVVPGARWLDVGSGTGALSETILRDAAPSLIRGIDCADAYVALAREHIHDPRATFDVGDAQALPVENRTYDAVVSGLVLNFIPDMSKALQEMTRAVKPAGTVAVYVWDYADQMQMMRFFWDAATALHPEQNALDESLRFPICKPEPLAELFQSVGLTQIETRSIDIPTRFRNFDDYWNPFLGGQGSAPTYVKPLSDQERSTLRDDVRQRLPISGDGSIDLVARAWAVRGQRV